MSISISFQMYCITYVRKCDEIVRVLQTLNFNATKYFTLIDYAMYNFFITYNRLPFFFFVFEIKIANYLLRFFFK